MSRALITTAVLLILGSRAVFAQDGSAYQLSLPTVVAGAQAEVTVTMAVTDQAPHEVAAYSYGVCHASSELDIESLVLGADIATFNGNGPSFHSANEDFFGGGFMVGCVLNQIASFGLPVGQTYELDVVTYSLTSMPGTTTNLEFCETLGSPPFAVAVVLVGGANLSPQVENGSIHHGSPFDRGNCNGDAAFDLADAVALLSFLFPAPGTSGSLACLDACDANDDGLINLADAVSQFDALFGDSFMTFPLPEPYGACGPDPTPDLLDCAAGPC